MPRYFFDVSEAQSSYADEEGTELPDLAAARAAAIKGIRSILCSEVMRGAISLRGLISIRLESGAVLEKVPFGAAVRIEERAPALAG